MTAIRSYFQPYFRALFFILGIVLSAALCSCGGGADSTKATDGTTITASNFSVEKIYIATSSLGVKQASINFTVSKAGVGLASQSVKVTLSSQAIAAGVSFSGGATSTTLTTDTKGITPDIFVTSGSAPTSVIVDAVLSSNSAVKVSASGLSITSGNPTQQSFSLQTDKTIIEGYDITTAGQFATLTVRLTDRMGNYVPAGTIINFTTASGPASVTPTCTLDETSKCTVTLTSLGSSTTQLVTVLAYANGEESFVDVNGNNKYDIGVDTFTDIGTPYRDDNRNGVHDTGEQTIASAGTGNAVCTPPANTVSKSNTCNGIWDATTTIRKEIDVLFARSVGFVITPSSVSASSLNITVGDAAGFQAPPGTSITGTFPFLASGSTCAVKTITDTPLLAYVGRQTTQHTIALEPGCSLSTLRISVTTPLGGITSHHVVIP